MIWNWWEKWLKWLIHKENVHVLPMVPARVCRRWWSLLFAAKETCSHYPATQSNGAANVCLNKESIRERFFPLLTFSLFNIYGYFMLFNQYWNSYITLLMFFPFFIRLFLTPINFLPLVAWIYICWEYKSIQNIFWCVLVYRGSRLFSFGRKSVE